MIDFSVIIPAKNESKNIGKCLASIRMKCGYPDEKYEILVIDNGSTDDTVHVAKLYGARVFIKPDITIASLRNLGASMASGSIFVFIDADCSVKNGWLREASRYLEKSDVVCFGSAPAIPENATWVQKTWFQVRKRGDGITETPWLESMNMFIKRDAFQNVKGFDDSLITCEDVDISYRLSNLGKIISDSSIRAIHHGEAATIRIFFKKEKWRGKSNYKGLFRHGLKLSELPSLLIPLYYGVFFVMFFIAILLGWVGFGLLALVLSQLPVGAVTVYKLRGSAVEPLRFAQLHLLYNIYYLARFSAIFR